MKVKPMLQTNLWKTVKLHPQLHASLKAQAAANGLPLSDLLETILQDWLRRQGIQTPPVVYRKATSHDLFLAGGSNPRDDRD